MDNSLAIFLMDGSNRCESIICRHYDVSLQEDLVNSADMSARAIYGNRNYQVMYMWAPIGIIPGSAEAAKSTGHSEHKMRVYRMCQ